MNDIFERLKKLCENADMPVPEKSTEAAELKGYAARNAACLRFA